MFIWFSLSLLGFVLIVPVYFLSLEHIRLRAWLGDSRGRRVGDALGMISGWGFFGFWIGTWVTPQARFHLSTAFHTFLGVDLSWLNILISLIPLLPAFWFGLRGVMELGLETSETHRPVRVVSIGLYGVVRHPQYVGGMLGHIGVSILLGSLDALLVTPVTLLVVYVVSWKEESELVREFGEDYKRYQAEVPMFIPRLKRR
jgi:protein-S-isoprenylcysteine O-methyltransferase Ste14